MWVEWTPGDAVLQPEAVQQIALPYIQLAMQLGLLTPELSE